MPRIETRSPPALFSAGAEAPGAAGAAARARDGRSAAWMALGWATVRGEAARVAAPDPWDLEQAAWVAQAAGATVRLLPEAELLEIAPLSPALPAPAPAPLEDWARMDGRPIRPERLSADLIASLPPGALLVLEGRPSGAGAAAAATRPDVEVLRHVAGPARGASIACAVGAKAAAPERPVVVLVDEASFALAAMDVQSAAEAGLPVAVVVANAARDAAGRPFAYENLADVVGGHGEAVSDPSRLFIHLRNAIAATIPTVINAIVTPSR